MSIEATVGDSFFEFQETPTHVGSTCDVHEGTVELDSGTKTRPIVVKVGRTPNDKLLLDKEQEVLNDFWKAITDDPELGFFGHTLPKPYGSFDAVVPGDPDSRPASALRRSRGRTAQSLLEKFPNGIPPVQVAWMLTRLLTTLAAAHQCGWVHGAVFPDHLLVRWDNTKEHRYAKVLGWTAAVKKGEKLKTLSPMHMLFYPPEAFNGHPVGPETDLYMFGQTANALLGGDLKHRKVPKSVPAPLRGAIHSCLIPNTNRRPDHAANFLFRVFRPALAEIWGSPKYIPFHLPSTAAPAVGGTTPDTSVH